MTNTSTKITLSRLSQYGLLSVVSTDNVKFLQGQLTCDVKEVTTEQWRYGALCTNKGRMISNFLLAEVTANQHLLRTHASTIEAVASTLKKFAPFYKGSATDNSTDYVILGLSTTESETVLDHLIKTVFADTSLAINAVKTTDQFTLIRLDQQRYECWIKKEFFDKYWSILATSASIVEETQWDLLNIRAGLGEVRKQTIEEWTPHMLNLQAIGAINFKKGCYTGQEIVARTEYRGQQKRAMYRISGQGSRPEPALAIFDGAQQAGEIVMAAASHPDQWEALAVISDPHLNKPLQCNGESIEILSLPYIFRKTATA